MTLNLELDLEDPAKPICSTNFDKATKILDKKLKKRSKYMIYLDLSKAFDKVPRIRQGEKLDAHGFGRNLLAWVKIWLTGTESTGKSSFLLLGSSTGTLRSPPWQCPWSSFTQHFYK